VLSRKPVHTLQKSLTILQSAWILGFAITMRLTIIITLTESLTIHQSSHAFAIGTRANLLARPKLPLC
jgi:energy-coupling factor transporter transmembrane protein EcfT